jgi:hypothetical protein
MRKVVLGLGISLDGYIARPDGAVDFLFMPKDYSMGPFFATIDTAIMGARLTTWPSRWVEEGSATRRCRATSSLILSRPANAAA